MSYRARHSLKPLEEFTILGKILLLESLVKKVSSEKKISKKPKAKNISDLNKLIDKYTNLLSFEDKEEREKLTVSLQSLREIPPPLESKL